MCLIFVIRGVRRKFFHAEFFPNYGMLKLNTLSSKSTRFNPYFGRYNYKQHKPAKVGIKSCRFALRFNCHCLCIWRYSIIC